MGEHNLSTNEFSDYMKELYEKMKENPQPSCTAIYIDEENRSIDIVLDTQIPSYGEWIKGEGGDICLYRDTETDKVIGCHLPLYHKEVKINRHRKSDITKLEEDETNGSPNNDRNP